MKNLLAVTLMAALFASQLTACSGGNKAVGETEKTTKAVQGESASDERLESLKKAYENIEPLEEETTIRYIGTVGLQLGSPLWIAKETGALEEAGITLKFTPAQTGPLSIEALTAGEVDLVGTGIGGIAVGAVQGSAKMLCYINNDSVIQKFYVEKDSPLAQTAFNEETGFYGTAEDWKGKEVYMPAGTTLQYLMGVSMNKLGLTLQDIKPVYMDANNVNTAMYAKQGEVWGIWNFLCYASALKEEGFVPVIEGGKVGIDLVTAFATNDTVWADAGKRAAIEKILEYHFATVKWMGENDDNMRLAAEIITKWCEEEGVPTSVDEMFAYLSETYYFDYDENYQMFTENVTNEKGTMLKAVAALQGIMDFYVDQGNYTEEDRNAMISNQDKIFTKDGLESISGTAR